MNEIAPSDKIQWLEQRHAELIEELDVLNNRLEQALNSFSNPAEPAEEETPSRTTTRSEVGR